MLKHHASRNSSCLNLKVCKPKVQKNLSKMNVYVTQQFQNFDFQWKISLQIMSFCFQFIMLFLLTLNNIIQGLTKQMIAHLTMSSRNHTSLVLYIVESDKKDLRLYIRIHTYRVQCANKISKPDQSI